MIPFFLAAVLFTLWPPQVRETFKVRLSPVPVDATSRNTTTGNGAATATLAGNKLTISGTFEGLQAAATAARLHTGKVTGIRGTAFAELEVSKAPAGTLSGSLTLTREQIDNLKRGRLYIQIHSEKAPDGNLWGWLLR
jgi:hypothetical protein